MIALPFAKDRWLLIRLAAVWPEVIPVKMMPRVGSVPE